MLHRAFKLLLAAVLFWSALATQEHPLQWADVLAGGEIAGAATGDPRGGSVDEHHLDDLPGQHTAEPAGDLPAWFPATATVLGFGDAGQSRRRACTVAIADAAWDVPHRPPRA